MNILIGVGILFYGLTIVRSLKESKVVNKADTKDKIQKVILFSIPINVV